MQTETVAPRFGPGEQVTIEGQERNIFSTVPAPFFMMPSWWRRFMFRLLTPRDLSVYLYICSLLGPKGTAFPTRAQIAYDLGLKNEEAVLKSVRKLEDLGFLIRTLRQIPGRKTSTRRTIYQRPAPEFTLLKLLEKGHVDGELFPNGKQEGLLTEELDRTANAVAAGLRSLLGSNRYETYAKSDLGRRNLVLPGLLEGSLQERTGKTYRQLADAVISMDTKTSDDEKP